MMRYILLKDYQIIKERRSTRLGDTSAVVFDWAEELKKLTLVFYLSVAAASFGNVADADADMPLPLPEPPSVVYSDVIMNKHEEFLQIKKKLEKG